MDPTGTDITSFRQLGFVRKLLVWAVRMRLNGFRGGADDFAVAHAFHLGGLERAHASLLIVIDGLSAEAIERRETASPELGAHEVALLNALAHLHDGRADAARDCLRLLYRGAGAFNALFAMRTVVHELEAQNLRVLPVGGASAQRRSSAMPASLGIH